MIQLKVKYVMYRAISQGRSCYLTIRLYSFLTGLPAYKIPGNLSIFTTKCCLEASFKTGHHHFENILYILFDDLVIGLYYLIINFTNRRYRWIIFFLFSNASKSTRISSIALGNVQNAPFSNFGRTQMIALKKLMQVFDIEQINNWRISNPEMHIKHSC